MTESKAPTDNLEAGAGDLCERLNRAAVDLERKFLHRIDHSGEDWRLVNPNGDLAAAIIREAAAQLAAVTAENARLREAIADLNVTDQELVRIHNMCTGFDGDVKIWAKMLHKLAVFALAARTALSQEAPK